MCAKGRFAMNVVPRSWLCGRWLLVMVAGVAALAGAQRKAKARVFFVEPKNGATVDEPGAHEVRQSRAIEIAAGSAGRRQDRAPGNRALPRRHRPGCLARRARRSSRARRRGSISATASRNSTCSCTPGKHKLALQLGDDLHNTMPGLCARPLRSTSEIAWPASWCRLVDELLRALTESRYRR